MTGSTEPGRTTKEDIMLQLNEVPWSTRLTGAVLAVGVAVAHIADQGGVTNFNDTADWIGWAYRLTEIGGVATAALLLFAGGIRLAWVPAVLLAAGPGVSFVLSRTTGLPGDSGDKGNWAWDIGALSLVIEVALLVIALGALLTRTTARTAATQPSRPAQLVH
jgi:hypothetical protein